jgi:hypothetical protein
MHAFAFDPAIGYQNKLVSMQHQVIEATNASIYFALKQIFHHRNDLCQLIIAPKLGVISAASFFLQQTLLTGSRCLLTNPDSSLTKKE